MRVAAAITAGLALLAVGLLITLSHRAPRQAGSDHISPAIFTATLPRGGLLCQDNPYLPPKAATVAILVGTYGRPVPALGISFTTPSGAVVSSGHLQAGTRQGTVSIPISPAKGDPGSAVNVCLSVGGPSKFVVAGEGIPPDPTDETVDGVAQPGRISLVYYRAGDESWFSLLPTLDKRFGLGKAAFFGDWTLPACIVALLAIWAVVVRLLMTGEDDR